MHTFFTMEGGDSEFENFTLPTLKAFLEACSQNVSGYRMPQNAFFPQNRDLHVSQTTMQRPFFPLSITFLHYFLQLQQWWHLYCFAILHSTSIVIHSVKQCLLRNRPGSDAATSCDFLHERLQRAFTCANQLH